MLRKQFGDALVESLNRADKSSQLRSRSFNDEAVRFDDGQVVSERTCASDLVQAFGDDGGFAAVVMAIERAQLVLADGLNGGESGPGLQKIAGLNGGDIADPVQSLWEILFEETGDAIGQSHASIDEFSALLTQGL